MKGILNGTILKSLLKYLHDKWWKKRNTLYFCPDIEFN
jgi:hypothetical protein